MKGRRLGISVVVVAASLISIVGCTGSGDPVSQKGVQKNEPLAPKVTDPVCGMTLTSDQVVATHDYQGKTYQFCMMSDRDAFAADPDRFLRGGADSTSCPHHGDMGGDHGGMDTTGCMNHGGDGGTGDDGHGGHHGGDGGMGGMHGGR
jgi:YHS domain-containing protein